MGSMANIAYQCKECGKWVESSSHHHDMNWCECGKLGVDDHAMGYGCRVVGTPQAFRNEEGEVRDFLAERQENWGKNENYSDESSDGEVRLFSEYSLKAALESLHTRIENDRGKQPDSWLLEGATIELERIIAYIKEDGQLYSVQEYMGVN